MGGAEVVTVRLGVRRERTDHGGRVRVGIGQCRDGGAPAAGSRTTTKRAHARTLAAAGSPGHDRMTTADPCRRTLVLSVRDEDPRNTPGAPGRAGSPRSWPA